MAGEVFAVLLIIIWHSPGIFAGKTKPHSSLPADEKVTDTATTTVTLTVSGGNKAPDAVDDMASTMLDTPVDIDVLANDSDLNGDPLTLAAVGTPTSGTAAISGSLVTYTPMAAFMGTATFSYTISDGSLTDSASVSVTVESGNNEDTPPFLPRVVGTVIRKGTITTTDSTPVISGTAEPGSTIRLTIDLGGGESVTYETTTNENGSWSIDLESATPVSDTLPEGGLPAGAYTVSVTVTDVAGNVSALTIFTLMIEGRGTTNISPTIYLPLVMR